jgi:predicted O-methyltransferase YrrM
MVFSKFPQFAKRMTRKTWRALNQDRLEIHKYQAVQEVCRIPNLTPLEQVVVGTTGTTGMAGHVLFMYNLVRFTNAQLIVEIGLGPGDSTGVFLLALKETGGKLISIDIERQPVAETKIDQLGLRDHWQFIQKPSEDVPREWPAGHKIDILLVDGLHTYDQVRLEYRLYRPLMRNGGYILFHDSETIRGVRKFTQQLARRQGGVQFPFSNGLYVLRIS